MLIKNETIKEIIAEVIAEDENAIDRSLDDWEKTLVEISIYKAIGKLKVVKA